MGAGVADEGGSGSGFMVELRTSSWGLAMGRLRVGMQLTCSATPVTYIDSYLHCIPTSPLVKRRLVSSVAIILQG